MRKGVKALQNVACLKFCREAGIVASWNLLYGFPGEDPREYRRILDVLERITHLTPPTVCTRVGLVRFSPAYSEGTDAGFMNIRPHRAYSEVGGLDRVNLEELATEFEFDYADGRRPETYAGPVLEFVRHWKSQVEKGHLIYHPLHDDRGLIADTRFNRVGDRFELEPVENLVYRICDTPTKLPLIHERVRAARPADDVGPERVRRILDEFDASRLIVRDVDEYLSVALSDTTTIPWHVLAGVADRD